jgi:hypothetical protein
MKRSISCLIIFLAATVSMYSQTAPDAPELTRLLNEFLAGAGRNDAAVHDRFWADDLIYTRSAGVRIGKEELMKGVRSAPPPKAGDPVTVYTAEDVRIQQYGNAAVVAFKLVSATSRSDGTKTTSYHLNTGTFIKRKGLWQAVAWQATTVPKPGPEAKAASQPGAAGTSSVNSDSTRSYVTGSKGGCYYLGTGDKKVYVDHKYCK